MGSGVWPDGAIPGDSRLRSSGGSNNYNNSNDPLNPINPINSINSCNRTTTERASRDGQANA